MAKLTNSQHAVLYGFNEQVRSLQNQIDAVKTAAAYLVDTTGWREDAETCQDILCVLSDCTMPGLRASVITRMQEIEERKEFGEAAQ